MNQIKSFTVYIDGNSIGSVSDNAWTNLADANFIDYNEGAIIGANLYSNKYTNGSIDNIQIHNKVLSNDELACSLSTKASQKAQAYGWEHVKVSWKKLFILKENK